MKLQAKRFSNFIVSIAITALLLTGAVPSFAWDTAWAAEPAFAAETEQAEDAGSTVLPAVTLNEKEFPELNGESGIVLDMATGTVLYEKNADEIREPASLTKILNLLVSLETLDMDQVVTIPEGIETSGTTIGLVPGEEITVKNLMYGMMMESGNDAAEALAITAGGSVEEFGKMMNARAKECGAEHTDYKSPNGLNENPDQLNYTTARDLALISMEAMKNPKFRKIVSTKKYTIPATNKSEERELVNSNVCLWRNVKLEVNGKKVPYKYKGCNGIKTGFTSDAGYCLAGSAKQGGTDYIAITLKADGYRNRCRDVIKMWDYAFANYETYQVIEGGSVVGVRRVKHGEKRKVELGIQEDLSVTINKGTAEEQGFTTEFRFDEEKVTAPVKKGQKMGQALVFNGKGRLVGEQDIYALASVGEGGPLSYIGIADEDVPLTCGIAGAVVLLIIILLLIRRSRKQKSRVKQQKEIKDELKNMRTAGVGLTRAELSDVTGEEIIQPIPKGPSRISNEELNAWTNTSSRSSGRFSAPDMPKMKITPKTSFTGGQKSMSDEELFAMLESTKVSDVNTPRHHAKLTDTERREVMSRTRRGFRSERPARSDQAGQPDPSDKK